MCVTPTLMTLAVFWRRQRSITKHRNPSCSLHAHVTLHLMTFDELHCIWACFNHWLHICDVATHQRQRWGRRRTSSSSYVSGTNKQKRRRPMQPLHVLHDFSIRTNDQRSTPGECSRLHSASTARAPRKLEKWCCFASP